MRILFVFGILLLCALIAKAEYMNCLPGDDTRNCDPDNCMVCEGDWDCYGYCCFCGYCIMDYFCFVPDPLFYTYYDYTDTDPTTLATTATTVSSKVSSA